MSVTHATEIAELEASLCLDAPLNSSVLPRWQRKMRAASTTSAAPSSSTPSKPTSTSTSTSSSTTPARAETTAMEAEQGDRFVPNRGAMNMELSQYTVAGNANSASCSSSSSTTARVAGAGAVTTVVAPDAATTAVVASRNEFDHVMQGNLLDEGEHSSSSGGSGSSSSTPAHRVLSFRTKAPQPQEGYHNSLRVLYSQNKHSHASAVRPKRHIPSAPLRILDAPELMDDYYLNLLSWSSANVLAVALGPAVYLWNAGTGDITELMALEDPDAYISSVSWLQQGGTHLAIGTSEATTQLWDTAAGKQVRCMDGHSERISALAWNNHILSTGSRDTTVVNHDVRIRQHATGVMRSHQQEVCGLAWSPDGAYLASGGNDNLLNIWDAGASSSANVTPRFMFTDHLAAVKALAWSPHERNLLASGGGTADRCIKLWNCSTGALAHSVDTGSQVCSLLWSPTDKELLSSHGYAENQLCLWSYPRMARVKELKGHSARVLHMAMSPDQSTVVSASADETLRFWNVFSGVSTKKSSAASARGQGASQLAGAMKIR